MGKSHLINNRQGGRRRGRGGQRPQNLSGRPDGNRQDNRQRGNAAQLLEKYKSMARDAQLGGDRVQTEYYLQYAEHYYRVLGESRARFEEQRRARGEDMDEDEDDDMSDGGDDQDSPDQPVRADSRPQRNDRNDRYDRDRSDGSRDGNRDSNRDGGERYQGNGGPRGPRYARNDGNGEGVDRGAGDVSDSRVAEDALRAPRPPRNANRGGGERASASVESISFDALPPAIGREAPVDAADSDEPARPKRRVRKPRAAEDDSDIAPAA
jgi:hypothetical protein